MPKVIKPGKKEFIGICSRCGCEFSYTIEELNAQYSIRYVRCPECGDEYYHPDQSNNFNETFGDYDFEKEIKDSLKVFKQFSEGKHVDDSDWSYHPTVSKSCPVCGETMTVDDSAVLTSNPPQYWWRCPICGHAESHVCNGGENEYVTTSSYEYPKIH